MNASVHVRVREYTSARMRMCAFRRVGMEKACAHLGECACVCERVRVCESVRMSRVCANVKRVHARACTLARACMRACACMPGVFSVLGDKLHLVARVRNVLDEGNSIST
eukprot:2476973-Pleurochrysis_carterae.AAC.1